MSHSRGSSKGSNKSPSPKKPNGKETSDERTGAGNETSKNAGKKASQRPFWASRRAVLVYGIVGGLALPTILQKSRLLHHDSVPPMVKDVVLRPLDQLATALSEYTEELRMFDLDTGPRRLWDQLMPEMDFRPLFSSPERPGLRMKEAGLTPHHPVIMVPGFITSGLEIWQGEKCLQQYFRQRIWGTTRMLRSFMSDQACWLRHMAMDPLNGMDPGNIRLRAAQGLGAADYVIGAYWVWAQVIENLADIGYTSSDMYLASYDWRLSPPLLEKRDRFMTRLADAIELQVEVSGKPVVIVSHSYGSQVVKYFLNWIESENGAGKVVRHSSKKWGKRGWVKKYVAGFVNVAGPMLGVPPSVSSLLSGEMRETAELGAMSAAFDYYLPPISRVKLFRTWNSLVSMMLMGGDTIWGNLTYAPDDVAEESSGEPGDEASAEDNAAQAERNAASAADSKHEEEERGRRCQAGEVFDETAEDAEVRVCVEPSKVSLGAIISFAPGCEGVRKNSTVAQVWEELLRPKQTLRGLDDINDVNGVAKKGTNLRAAKWDHSRYWTNPLTSALPDAPDMKVYCFYGVGRKTERAYLYKRAPETIRCEAEEEDGKESDDAEKLYSNNKNDKTETQGAPGSWLPVGLSGAAAADDVSSELGEQSPLNNTTQAGTEPPKGGDAKKKEEGDDVKRGEGGEASPADVGSCDNCEGKEGQSSKDNKEDDAKRKTQDGAVDLSFETEDIVPYVIDSQARGGFENGMRMGQGDGTVPLMSLGYMCNKGWTDPSLPFNPSRLKVVTKEFPHKPQPLSPRGGGTSGHHIDILGNVELIEQILKIAAGRGSEVEPRILSGIKTVADRVIMQ